MVKDNEIMHVVCYAFDDSMLHASESYKLTWYRPYAGCLYVRSVGAYHPAEGWRHCGKWQMEAGCRGRQMTI